MREATTATNKALILRFHEEVWSKGNVEFAYHVFAGDYLRHDLRPGQVKVATDSRKAFPDIRFTIDLAIAEGDLVCLRWTATGTMTGDWGDQKATGKFVQYSGVNIFRLARGKVVKIWNHRDDLSAAQQLGAPVYAGSAMR